MVKRYNTELEKDGGLGLPSLTMRSSSIGSWVEYKDYAALEAKCAALAAKINVIKELMEVAEQINKLAQEETEKLAHERNMLAAENAGLKEACGGDGSYRDCPACAHSEYIEAPETQATDAFMAEVRAQGVDMFGQYHNFSEKLFIQKEAKKFAAQLRQGAAL